MTLTKNATKEKIFFPNLDGLRFICFFVVFLFHCYKTIFQNIRHSSGYHYIESLFQNGTLGVNFFFVLSGFLITYLLIREKEYKGTISVKNFYIRRILRIWPLFYLCVAFGFLVFPFVKSLLGQPSEEIAHPVYYLFFVNNFDFMHSWPAVPDALVLSVLWSVAVEEQFYLSWPVILKFIPIRYYRWIFPGIIAASLIFRSFYTGDNDHDYAFRYFHTLSVIGDMAFGGLLAYFCSYENRFFRYIRNLRRYQIAIIYIAAIIIFIFKKQLFHIPVLVVLERLVISSFFGLIILEQNYAKNSFFKFSQFKLISKLGLYTYGLYCLHFIGILVVQTIAQKTGWNLHSFVMASLASLLALLVAILVSITSYYLFEKRFLDLKDKFAFIVKK
jgi:peptidoglycan/LPS O-acetylase OafA/YrhL